MATLTAKKRESSELGKKKFSKKIRKENLVPAIIYGSNKEPLPIILNPIEYLKELNASDHKKNEIFEIQIDKKKETVITKEIVVNPVNNEFIHIDFIRVEENKKIEVKIPISIQGTSVGQRLGGVLVNPKATLLIKCLPNAIPTNIPIDITELQIGDNIRAGELKLNDSQELISNPKDILIKIEATKVSKVTDDNELEGATDAKTKSSEESNGNGSEAE